jgi:hypothetical protein
VDPALPFRTMRSVTTRQVRTISRKDHVQAAAVSDDYLFGLIDGEGMFHVGIVPSFYTRLGWQVIYLFKVAQNPIGESVLVALQERLGCGTISPNARAGARDRTLKYVVRDLESLNAKVVPFCEGRLIVKRQAFESFKRVLDLVNAGRHLTATGLLEIVDIAYAMNLKARRVPRATIEAAIRGRGILTGHTPDSL